MSLSIFWCLVGEPGVPGSPATSDMGLIFDEKEGMSSKKTEMTERKQK